MTPLKPAAIRIGKNESGNRTGILLKAFSSACCTLIIFHRLAVYRPMYQHYVCVSGYVYVDLHSDEQVEKALKKNKDYIGEKYSTLSHVCLSFLSVC